MNKFFKFLSGIEDLQNFLTWFYDAKISEVAEAGVPADANIKTAVMTALKNGASATNLEELYEATSYYYEQVALQTPPAKKEMPWQKTATVLSTTPTAAAQTTAKKEVLNSEDLRNWPEEELEDKILDLFDAAFKKHKLPFSIEESGESIDRTMTEVMTSEEPITLEELARQVNNRYSGIAKNRYASKEIQAFCNGHKFSQEVFGKLKTMVRNNTFSEFIANTAKKMEEMGHSPDETIAVIERCAYYGGNQTAFDRAYTRVIGETTPTTTITATTPAQTNVASAFSRAKTGNKTPPWKK